MKFFLDVHTFPERFHLICGWDLLGNVWTSKKNFIYYYRSSPKSPEDIVECNICSECLPNDVVSVKLPCCISTQFLKIIGLLLIIFSLNTSVLCHCLLCLCFSTLFLYLPLFLSLFLSLPLLLYLFFMTY